MGDKTGRKHLIPCVYKDLRAYHPYINQLYFFFCPLHHEVSPLHCSSPCGHCWAQVEMYTYSNFLKLMFDVNFHSSAFTWDLNGNCALQWGPCKQEYKNAAGRDFCTAVANGWFEGCADPAYQCGPKFGKQKGQWLADKAESKCGVTITRDWLD